jgi:cell division protein FtsI/penicillin-binding protein 2
MVTPLQLARVYATIGSYGVYRPLSITKVDPPVPGERIFPESIVRTVVHMMESVALPGGGAFLPHLCFLPIISRWISLTVNTAPVTQGMIALLTISAL